jgi:AraC-like DNA-binding protein
MPIHLQPRELRVDTDSVPHHERKALWERTLGSLFAAVRIDGELDADFRASLRAISIGDIYLIQTEHTPYRGYRAAMSRDAAGEERCLLLICQAGAVHQEHNHRRFTMTAGQMALMDPRRSNRFEIRSHLKLLGVSLPRQSIVARLGPIDELAGTAFPEGAISDFTRHYVELLLESAPRLVGVELAQINSHIIDLLAIALGQVRASQQSAASGSASSHQVTLLQRIKDSIELHLADPDLDIAWVAARFRVTPRYVTELFRGGGTTFSAFTRDLRLSRCKRLLELSVGSPLSIGEIARQSGFGSQAYLNRAFKAAYGMTPGEYRRQMTQRD